MNVNKRKNTTDNEAEKEYKQRGKSFVIGSPPWKYK